MEDSLKMEKIKDNQALFDQLLVEHEVPRKRNFPSKRNDKSEKDVHAISAPTPRYQEPYVPPAPIYQLTAPPPPPLTYKTM